MGDAYEVRHGCQASNKIFFVHGWPKIQVNFQFVGCYDLILWRLPCKPEGHFLRSNDIVITSYHIEIEAKHACGGMFPGAPMQVPIHPLNFGGPSVTYYV